MRREPGRMWAPDGWGGHCIACLSRLQGCSVPHLCILGCSHSADGPLSPDYRQRGGGRLTAVGVKAPPVKGPERQQRRHKHVDHRDG